MNFNGFTKFGIEQRIMHPMSRGLLDIYESPSRRFWRRGVESFYPGQINDASQFFSTLERDLLVLKDRKALIFIALKDKGMPKEEMMRFETVFPNHRTIEFVNAGNFFFEHEGSAMIAAINEFMTAKT